MSSLFRLESVTLRIGDRLLLDGIDLDLPDGPSIAVCGPSGAGKSTLLRLLNALEAPSSGRVWFRGVPVSEIGPRALRRRVGMVFQRPTTFAGSVFDNLRVADPSMPRERATESLATVGLDADLLDVPAERLSGGEAQRVCLLRSLATGPEVLLLDEPTSALDPEARDQLEATVAEVAARSGTRTVWVSHDLEQQRRVADWVVEIEHGRVVASGPR